MSEFAIIGLFGPAQSGKDLVADWFTEKGFVKIAYADPMKRFAQRVFGVSPQQLWGPSEERNMVFDIDDNWWFAAADALHLGADEIKNSVLDNDRVTGYVRLLDWMMWLRKKYPFQISARIILQTMGTEWGRAVNPHLWTNYAHKLIDELAKGEINYTQGGGAQKRDFGPVVAGVIVPDHRFKNEVQLMQEKGGYVIRLRRLAIEKKDETIGLAGHQSEAESKTMGDDIFDYVLEFEEGVEKVYEKLADLYEKAPWKNKVQARNSL